MQSDMHPNRVVTDKNGELTYAEFNIADFWMGPYDYVRMTIVDNDGKKAWTNPIFL